MGSTPTNIPTFPFDGERILSSNEALGLAEIPGSILIVGGGVIGCEFACILATLGSRVTVVEALDRLLPLPSVDSECSKVLQREMKKRMIDIHVNRTVLEVTQTDTGTSVTIGPSPFASNLREKDKEPIVVTADKVLVSIGRSPATSGVGLSTIGVALTEKGWIRADDHMRTSAAGVYAIGDVFGPEKVMLAHATDLIAEGALATQNGLTVTQIAGTIHAHPTLAEIMAETALKASDRALHG
jgi:dihydrolipoamide dehydrogenase